jgi:hypothetical protein
MSEEDKEKLLLFLGCILIFLASAVAAGFATLAILNHNHCVACMDVGLTLFLFGCGITFLALK